MRKLLTQEELAKRWGMNPGSLAIWRIKGKGPKFVKIGRKIFYTEEEIEAFEQKNMKRSTVG